MCDIKSIFYSADSNASRTNRFFNQIKCGMKSKNLDINVSVFVIKSYILNAILIPFKISENEIN